MASVKRPRRYYLLQRQQALRDEDISAAGTWRWKQERQPGTPLPDTFYLLTRLAEQGYTTIEDLDGADECELEDACFSARETQRVFEELAELVEQPPPPAADGWNSLDGDVLTTLSGEPYTYG